MNKIKTIILLSVIYTLDMLVFKAPFLSGLLVIVFLFLLIFYAIKKDKIKIKNFFIFLGLTLFINFITMLTGDFLNNKIKEISLVSYNEAIINKRDNIKLNIYNRPVNIYKEKNNYVMYLYLYNYEGLIYKNNQWIENNQD